MDKKDSSTPTRRGALKTAAGAVTMATLGATPTNAQTADRQLWKFEAGSTSPTVVNNTVFLVSSSPSKYFAVDAKTGDKRWGVKATGTLHHTSPTVVDGFVFVADASGLYALTARSGTRLWSFGTVDARVSSPTVADSTVFIGSGDGKLYALDAATGTRQWVFRAGDRMIRSSPTVVDGTVFIGSRNSNIYAIDADTGEQQWKFKTGKAVYSSPTVAGGTVFIASRDGNLYAVDANTGKLEWSFKTENTIEACPTVLDGTVFIGNTDRTLYAVNTETGELQWSTSFDTYDIVRSSPTVVDETVFIGSGSKVYSVDANIGTIQWTFETETDIESSPTVVDGTVFIGDDSNLYALDADVEGSSEGSRVSLGTLGHHDVWDAKQSIDEPSPPKFVVSNVSPDGTAVTKGSEITVTADIENTGGESGTQTVNYRLDTDGSGELEYYEELARQSVSVDAGDTMTVTFKKIDTSAVSAGVDTYTHGVFTSDDSATGSITIEESPSSEPSSYTNDKGYVDSEGLLDAGADYRNGEIDDDRLSEVASAFRSGEPLA